MSQMFNPLPPPNPFAEPPPLTTANPARLIINQKRIKYPNGRELVWYLVIDTDVQPPQRYVTLDHQDESAGDCGCPIPSPSQAFFCSATNAIVCPRHCVTCQCCGRVRATWNCQPVVIHNQPAIVCAKCIEQINGSEFSRLISRIRRFFRGDDS